MDDCWKHGEDTCSLRARSLTIKNLGGSVRGCTGLLGSNEVIALKQGR